jgi:hypothetical protein
MKEEKEYSLATTEIVDRLHKYDFEDEDYGEKLFYIKQDIQSLIHLFALIHNVIGERVSPEQWEMLDKTRDTLIDYLEKYHLNKQE